MTCCVTEIQRLSVHDGPGIRTTVFVKGCPLRCKWCSNPETWNPHPELYYIAKKCVECGKCVQSCPENAIGMDKRRKIDRQKCTLCMLCVQACKNGALEKVGREVTPKELSEKIKEDYPFYVRSNGGVTISGGEPLYQPDFVSQLLKICHEEGIHTCIDTSGYAELKNVKQVLKHVDLVLLDIKQMDSVTHRKWTGVPNELILKNAELMASECEVRISLPLIAGVNDSEENMRKTTEFAASLGIEYIDVLPFHRLGASKYEYLGLKSPFSDFRGMSSVAWDKRVDRVIESIKSHGLKTTKGRSM